MRGGDHRLARIAAAIALSMAILGGGSCQKRDRSNPFDPRNPESHGVPSLLSAQARNRRVDLVWDLGAIEGIERIDILRRTAGGSEVLVNPAGLEPSVHAYSDDAVENGTTYEYRLDLTLASGGRLATAFDPATPGDAVPWVCDSEGGGLSRLTADARRRLSSYGGGLWFLDVAADSIRRTLWTVEYLGGTIYEFDAGGEKLLEKPLLGARAVTVDSAGVWAGSFDTGRIERRALDGSLARADTTGGHIEALFAYRTGEVWIALAEGGVQICTEDGNRLRFAHIGGFNRPVAIAGSGDRIYVLDRGAARVARLDGIGNVEAQSPDGLLRDPTDVTSDGGDGIWVCDPGRGGLVHLDRSFAEIRYVPMGGVLGASWERGRLWVAGLMGVRLLDRDGGAISGMKIGPRPIRVAVIHNP